MFQNLCQNSKVAEYYIIFKFNMIISASAVQLSSKS